MFRSLAEKLFNLAIGYHAGRGAAAAFGLYYLIAKFAILPLFTQRFPLS